MPPVPTVSPRREVIRELVRQHVRERGISIAAFARQLGDHGRHPVTIWQICDENRGQSPSQELIKDIADGLGVRTIDISDWDDGEPGPGKEAEAATPAA